jgi:uncharacterized membrane protein (DUF373 family)
MKRAPKPSHTDIELFGTLIFCMREHRVSVPLKLEVAVVSELREIPLDSPTSLGTQVFGNGLLLAVRARCLS